MKEENKQTEKLKDDLDIFSERLIKSMNGEKGVSETGKMLARYYSAVSTLNNFSSKNISFLLNQVDDRNMNIALYNQDGKGMILNKVKSYKNWKSDGVQVEKGQKSLQVYAPVQQYKIKHDENNKPIKKGKYWDYEKDENGNKIKSGVKFIKVPVFNSDQTNAEELGLVKKIDFTNNRGDISSELLESFISEVSNKFDIPIKQEILSPNLGGFYVPSTHTITLNEARSNKDKLNILFHEVGHSILHKGEESQKISKGIKEAEAESVSFILSSKLGIQSEDSSIYIKDYGNDVKVVKDRLERITQASKDVFKKIDFDELIEREQERISKSTMEDISEQSSQVDLSEYQTKTFDSVDSMIEEFKSDNEDITINAVHIKDTNDEDRKNLDSLNQQLKDLDKEYYRDEISEEDYENMKQDLYVEIYKLEKLLGVSELTKEEKFPLILEGTYTPTIDELNEVVENLYDFSYQYEDTPIELQDVDFSNIKTEEIQEMLLKYDIEFILPQLIQKSREENSYSHEDDIREDGLNDEDIQSRINLLNQELKDLDVSYYKDEISEEEYEESKEEIFENIQSLEFQLEELSKGISPKMELHVINTQLEELREYKDMLEGKLIEFENFPEKTIEINSLLQINSDAISSLEDKEFKLLSDSILESRETDKTDESERSVLNRTISSLNSQKRELESIFSHSDSKEAKEAYTTYNELTDEILKLQGKIEEINQIESSEQLSHLRTDTPYFLTDTKAVMMSLTGGTIETVREDGWKLYIGEQGNMKPMKDLSERESLNMVNENRQERREEIYKEFHEMFINNQDGDIQKQLDFSNTKLSLYKNWIEDNQSSLMEELSPKRDSLTINSVKESIDNSFKNNSNISNECKSIAFIQEVITADYSISQSELLEIIKDEYDVSFTQNDIQEVIQSTEYEMDGDMTIGDRYRENFTLSMIKTLNEEVQNHGYVELLQDSDMKIFEDTQKEDSNEWKKDLISLETEDYQNRGGSYPRSGVPDTINTSDSDKEVEIEFSFKSTSEETAKRWVERNIDIDDSLDIDISTYQDGDYDDDWVSVIVKVQDLSHSQEHIKIEEPTDEDEDDFDLGIKPIDKKSLEINFEDDTSKQEEDEDYSQEQ